MSESFLFPPGRLVFGDGTGRNTDRSGKPLLYKSGAKVGQPKTEYPIGVAIPKEPGKTHWGETSWGAKVLAVGAAAFPNLYTNPKFAWKIIDGDSQVPNEANRRPCDQEGYPGNWIVKFNSGFAPKIVNENGSVEHTEPGYIKCGYYVQVYGTVDGNGEPTKPGVYLNHNIISFQGFGKLITSGPDAAAVGFGAQGLPAGASAAPLGGMSAAQAAAGMLAAPAIGLPALPGVPAGLPQLPGVPAAAAALPALPAVPGVPAVAAPVVPVMPNPAILAPAVPQVPAVPVAPAYQMTAKALGATREQMLGAGWTDDLMIAQGMMIRTA